MASLTLYFHGTVVGDDGVTIPIGSSWEPIVVTLGSGLVFRRDVTVPHNTTKLLFSVDNDLDDFDFMIVTFDQDVMLEWTTDLNNSVGDEVYTQELKAGIPFLLGGDGSFANYTPNFGGGTLDSIQRLRVRNYGSHTAIGSVIAGT